MKSEKISETNWRTIEETKALNYGLNAEETSNLQVTIGWTTITNSNNKNSNYNEDEMNIEQSSMFSGKSAFTQRRKISIVLVRETVPYRAVCVMYMSVVTVER